MYETKDLKKKTHSFASGCLSLTLTFKFEIIIKEIFQMAQDLSTFR